MTKAPGLRIESAASVILLDTIKKHMEIFAPVIRADRAANASVVAAYASGLAGAVALTIAGGHGSREDVAEAAIKSFRTALERDLKYLAGQ